MPNTKISALTAGNPAQGTDEVPIARGGANFKVTAASIAALSPAGTVTSVGGTGTVNGLTLTGTVTSSGNLTLGGTLSGVSLTTQVTGTLPLANGGTGATTKAAAFNALSPVTSTGDLILGNGANSNTRLPIGLNAYVLTSNGSTASWQPAAGGGGGVTSFSGGFTGLTPNSPTTGAVTLGGTLGYSYGGTGTNSFPNNGALLIGNGGGYSVNQLTAGSGISITPGFGTITIAATGGGGNYITFIQIRDGGSFFGNSSSPQPSPVVYWDAVMNAASIWFYSPSGGYNTSGFSISEISINDSSGSFFTYFSGVDFSSSVSYYANGNTVGFYGISISNPTLRTYMADTASQLGSPSISPRGTSPFGPNSTVNASVSGGINPSYQSSGYPVVLQKGPAPNQYYMFFKSNDVTSDFGLTLNSLQILNSSGSFNTYFTGSDFSSFSAGNNSNGEFSCEIAGITNPTLLTLLDNTYIV